VVPTKRLNTVISPLRKSETEKDKYVTMNPLATYCYALVKAPVAPATPSLPSSRGRLRGRGSAAGTLRLVRLDQQRRADRAAEIA